MESIKTGSASNAWTDALKAPFSGIILEKERSDWASEPEASPSSVHERFCQCDWLHQSPLAFLRGLRDLCIGGVRGTWFIGPPFFQPWPEPEEPPLFFPAPWPPLL